MWEYYIQSRDRRALTFLAGLGHDVRDVGRQGGGDGLDDDSLLVSCEKDLSMWQRPGSEVDGQAEWRLSPPRRLNWSFGTTSDLAWLMAALR